MPVKVTMATATYYNDTNEIISNWAKRYTSLVLVVLEKSTTLSRNLLFALYILKRTFIYLLNDL